MNSEIINTITKIILEKLDPKDIKMFKAETLFVIENNDIKKFNGITHTYIRKFAINAKKSKLQKLLELFKTVEKQIRDKEEIEFIDSFEDFKRVGWM